MPTTTIAAGAAAGGSSASLIIVLTWLAGLAHMQMPPEVAVSLAAILAPALHMGARALCARVAAAPERVAQIVQPQS